MSLHAPSSVTAMSQAFGAIMRPPTLIGTVALTTTPAVLVADDARLNGTRRLLIRNLDSTETAAINFLAKGAAVTGLTVANSYSIPPGAEQSFVVDVDVRIGVVASGVCDVSVIVSDI